ncbi:MAG: hypothetical protein AB7W16_09190 [Candidatus Obscuribacterales bacterium]
MRKIIATASVIGLLTCGVSGAIAGDLTIEQRLENAQDQMEAAFEHGRISQVKLGQLQDKMDMLGVELNTTFEKKKRLTSAQMKKFNTEIDKVFDDLSAPVSVSSLPGREEVLVSARKGMMACKQLSMTAKNVQLAYDEGTLVLTGPVKSEAEQALLTTIAEQSGAVKVENHTHVIE